MRIFNSIQPFLVISLLSLIGLYSCDDLSQPSGIPDKTVTLLNLTTDSDTLSFRNASAIKDTIVSFNVFVQVMDKSDLASNPKVNMYETGEFQLIKAVELTEWNEITKTYQGSFTIEISTGVSLSTDLVATAITSSGNASNFLRKKFIISGLRLAKPIVENPINPDTLFIPLSGSINFLLGVKVTHPDGQRFINQVSANLTDKDNESLGDFILYNDGSAFLLENNLTSGDISSADSVFSRSFTINSSNKPDVITLTYKALDTGNQVSNSITSTMVISQ
ncbi:MAG: hypothetical protein GW809_07975 [Bacteroidetes bacterium]|nr:hypothetical protein [Bacteroidota bacterium]NCQ12059.1 hypothetical protein [Bacteroidota bacterium]